MSFGTALRHAREAQGLTIGELALRTKIRGDYLRALEEGALNVLPERTFTRAYLQRYARELHLDPAPLLTEFDHVVPPVPGLAGPRLGRAAPRTPARRTRGPALAVGGVIVALLLAGAGTWVARTLRAPAAPVTVSASPAPVATAPVPAAPVSATSISVKLSVSSVPPGARVYLDNRDLGRAPVQSFPVDARQQAELRVEAAGRQTLRQSVDLRRSRNLRVTLAPAGKGSSVLTDLNVRPAARPSAARPAQPTPAKAAAPTAGVSVTFSGPSWTRVTDAAGQIVFEGTPAAGTVKTFPRGVTVRTGNAGAVRVSVDGAAAKPLGESGQVISRSF